MLRNSQKAGVGEGGCKRRVRECHRRDRSCARRTNVRDLQDNDAALGCKRPAFPAESRLEKPHLDWLGTGERVDPMREHACFDAVRTGGDALARIYTPGHLSRTPPNGLPSASV
ncbi:hypothetical protein MTO96_018093 [Rhipicephalus appendiculatus]